MNHLIGYRCSLCGQEYGPTEVEYVCPRHGDEGLLDAIYDYAAINAQLSPARLAARQSSAELNLFRYRPLLPVDSSVPDLPLHVGWTPLYRAPRLEKIVGRARDLDQRRWPHADRVVQRPRQFDHGDEGRGVEARSDHHGVERQRGRGVSGHGRLDPVARRHLRAADRAAGQGGAAVDLWRARLSGQGQLRHGLRSVPASLEGIWLVLPQHRLQPHHRRRQEDLRRWKSANNCRWRKAASSTGGPRPIGSSSASAMATSSPVCTRAWSICNTSAGSTRMPKLMGVQAEGAAAVYNAWRDGRADITPVSGHTLADSINVDRPRDGRRAVRAIRQTGGEASTVTDDEILDAMRVLARETAVFAEPAAARRRRGSVEGGERGSRGRRRKRRRRDHRQRLEGCQQRHPGRRAAPPYRA